MVTIKEVAKLAGVSHGTVSNVINGATNVSVNKIQRVKAAMKELGYKPNTIARSLKIEKTKEIELIIPNSKNAEYLELLDGVTQYAKEKGYFVNLQVTNEIPTEERRLLNEALMRNVAGVILITCQPENEMFFENIMKSGLHIVFAHHEPSGGQCKYVGFDIRAELKNSLKTLLKEGLRRVGIITGPREYSFEEEVLNCYFASLCEAGVPIEPGLVEVSDFNENSLFRAAMRMLNQEDIPEAVLVSNAAMVKSVEMAVRYVCGETSSVEILVLKPGDREEFDEHISIMLPFYAMAETACRMLLNSIEQKQQSAERHIIKVTENKELWKEKEVICQNTRQRRLRILLNESPSSVAVKLMLPDFKRKTGIDVEIVTRPYAEMFDEIWRNKKSDKYDIYSVDFPWMKDLAYGECLDCLNDMYQKNGEYQELFSEDVLQNSSIVAGDYYAVPYSFTVQLLFYRKDLFEKLENQRVYYEWYGEELKPPVTWVDFNRAAKLFTRKYNKISDTKYGVTLGARRYSGAVNEYLPRMYAYGGEIFSGEEVAVGDQGSINALKNYLESFQYADPRSVNWWWDEQVKEYCLGNAAMMVMYTEHVSSLEDRRYSNVVGKTQATVLPGRSSVLGGWSLGINRCSSNKEAGRAFLEWMMDYKLLRPHAALGRIIPSKEKRYRIMTEKIYSWFGTAWEAFAYARPRSLPSVKAGGKPPITEAEMEILLGDAVYSAVSGEMTVKQALERVREEMQKYITVK